MKVFTFFEIIFSYLTVQGQFFVRLWSFSGKNLFYLCVCAGLFATVVYGRYFSFYFTILYAKTDSGPPKDWHSVDFLGTKCPVQTFCLIWMRFLFNFYWVDNFWGQIWTRRRWLQFFHPLSISKYFTKQLFKQCWNITFNYPDDLRLRLHWMNLKWYLTFCLIMCMCAISCTFRRTPFIHSVNSTHTKHNFKCYCDVQLHFVCGFWDFLWVNRRRVSTEKLWLTFIF